MKCRIRQIAPDSEKAYVIEKGLTHIGRGVDNQIQLMYDQISRCHAELENTDDACVIKDLGSSNGTFVNGSKIKETQLCHGDEIKIGECMLKFELLNPSDTQTGEFVSRDISTRSMYMTVCAKKRKFPFGRKK